MTEDIRALLEEVREALEGHAILDDKCCMICGAAFGPTDPVRHEPTCVFPRLDAALSSLEGSVVVPKAVDRDALYVHPKIAPVGMQAAKSLSRALMLGDVFLQKEIYRTLMGFAIDVAIPAMLEASQKEEVGNG